MVGWMRNVIHALVCKLNMYIIFSEKSAMVQYSSRSEAKEVLAFLKSKGHNVWIKYKTERKYNDIN